MLRGFYSAATGQDAASLNQNIVAQNLANATVPGYRRQGLVFQTFEQVLAQAAPPGSPAAQPGAQTLAAGTGAGSAGAQTPAAGLEVGQPGPQPPLETGATTATGNSTDTLLGTQLSQVFNDFTSGPWEYTGNPLDVAAAGNTFFVVQGPGGELLTRNGTFRLNVENQLVTQNGYPVLGQGGTITIPPNTASITVTLDGVVQADGQEVGRLQLAQVPFPQMLVRIGTTFFMGSVPRTAPDPGAVRIEQGYREGSNVQPVTELVSMLSGLRLYQATDRVLRTLSEALALHTRPREV